MTGFGFQVELLAVILISSWIGCHCQSVCGRTYTSSTGTLTSPNYPSNYGNHESCTNIINVPGAARIHVSFDSFNTESGYDYLRYGSGSNPGNNQLGSFNGAGVPRDFQVESGSMWFTFTSDGSSTRSGYSLTWTSEDPETDPPVVSGCPDDIEASTDLGTTGITVTWIEPVATDASAITTVRSHSPGSTFLVGETHVAYIYTDAYGATSACTFLVIVFTVDTTSPTILNCPSNIHQTTELGTNETTVSWTEPSATDLSGSVNQTRTHAPSSVFPIGDTEVTYKFIDSSDNSANCIFTVMVDTVDTSAPDVSECPSDIRSVGGRHVSWKEPHVFDLSHNISTWRSHSPGLFLTDPVDVYYSFTDSSGNSVFCNFTIEVVYDVSPPIISKCPNDTYATVEFGSLGTPVYWNQPTVTDDNDFVMLLQASHYSGNNFQAGKTLVRYIYADDSYNLAICNFSVIVTEVDTTPPTILLCPSDVTYDITPWKSSIKVFWDPPVADDLSGNVSQVSQSHQPGERFSVGRTRVVYAFVDESKNEAFCTFHVNVKEVFIGNNSYVYTDTSPPVIINCPLDINQTTELGTSHVPVFWTEPSAIDLQGYISDTKSTHGPGVFFAVDTSTVVSYVFQDDSLNEAVCNFTVTISEVDNTKPTIVFCPSNVHEVVELGEEERSTIYWSEPVVTDISGKVTILSQSHTSGDTFPIGKTLVNYTFADGSGNSISCAFYVNVVAEDTKPPTAINCPSHDITADIADLSDSYIKVSWLEPTAADVSGDVSTLLQTHSSGDSFSVGSTTVIYIFADASNNIASCSFIVKVQKGRDLKPPNIMRCPSDITTDSRNNLNPSAVVTWSEPYAVDESGNVTLLLKTHSPGQTYRAGTTTVIYMFADSSMNIATCTFDVIVSVVETLAPVIISCPNNITEEIDPPSQGAIVTWEEPTGASRDTSLLLQTHVPGTFFARGTTIVSYIFKDKANNMEKCSFSVTVEGAHMPSKQIHNCPSNIITAVGPSQNEATVSWTEPFAVNLSPLTKISSTHSPGESFAIGATEVVYVFDDNDGYKEYCNFTVVVTRKADTLNGLAMKRTIESEHTPVKEEVSPVVISIASLALCLFIIVFVIVIIIVLAYVRKRSKDRNIKLEGLQLSANSSLRSISNL